MVGSKSSRVVYLHNDGRWPPQASVKGVRRAMCSFFNHRRQEHKTLATLSNTLVGTLDALEEADHDPRLCGLEIDAVGEGSGEGGDVAALQRLSSDGMDDG